MDIKFYECQVCGNVIYKIVDSGMIPRCCGRQMEELVPGVEGGSKEHHVPVCKVEGNKVHVCIGSEAHPMEEKHHISWIALKTTKGAQLKTLEVDDKPEACFMLEDGEKPEEVYAYCTVHKLWKGEI